MVRIIFALSFFFLNVSLAHAWRVNTCNGKIKGMRTHRTLIADLCNMPTNSQRYADVLYVFNEWNKIDGVSDRFTLANGNSNCAIDTDDAIMFVASADIDGNGGLTITHEEPCRWPYNTNSDGRHIDVKIHIADIMPLGPSSPRDTFQNARNVLFHEMGHALGAKHEHRTPNMMWDPANMPRTGDTDPSGNDFNRADGYTPNDIDFAATWHGSGVGGWDIAVGGQNWDSTTNSPFNLNAGVLTRCPGQQASVRIVHYNKGKEPILCSQAWEAIIVGSLDERIGIEDHVLQTWTLCGDRGTWWTNTATFPVPQMPPGVKLNVGFIVDPLNKKVEEDEANNSINLGIDIQYPQSGC